MTQQSLSPQGGAWSSAIQIEMSKTLRSQLARKPDMLTFMNLAIVSAWQLGLAHDPTQVPDMCWGGAWRSALEWLTDIPKHFTFPEELLMENKQSDSSQSDDSNRSTKYIATGNNEPPTRCDVP